MGSTKNPERDFTRYVFLTSCNSLFRLVLERDESRFPFTHSAANSPTAHAPTHLDWAAVFNCKDKNRSPLLDPVIPLDTMIILINVQ